MDLEGEARYEEEPQSGIVEISGSVNNLNCDIKLVSVSEENTNENDEYNAPQACPCKECNSYWFSILHILKLRSKR